MNNISLKSSSRKASYCLHRLTNKGTTMIELINSGY